MIVYYILCPSLRVVIFREEQGLSTFYMRCDVRKSVACFITFPNLLFVALLSLLTGARSWLRLSKVSNSTSLPLVSPRSNHSTVTLRVSILMPETTAEWMRPEIIKKFTIIIVKILRFLRTKQTMQFDRFSRGKYLVSF